ncbi:Presenilin/signal peptide peptidase [Gracilaria domingensis]|nr:Presenilin/signal peptide peptidase [Gracilaria domingensis]
MMGLSTVIIIISSYNAAERERKRRREGDTDPRDVIGRDQAMRFPLVASVALFGMFLAFKYLPKEWVSFLLTMYGITFGALAFAGVLGTYFESVKQLPPLFKKQYGHKDYLTLSLCDVLGVIFAVPIAVWYYKTRMWLPNNILAVSLALSAIDMLAIPDFKSSAVLLLGLFVYDIFWVFGSKSVFGSNVMVAVAKQFEGPIKLIFPKFLGAGPNDTSMLGLGDIVIPGLFIALMLRFDIRHCNLSQAIPSRLPYFFSAVLAYIAGLVATYAALTVFEAAQPALLYLVPSCLLTALGMSAVKREMVELIAYTEEEEDEKSAAKKGMTTAPDSSAPSADVTAASGTEPSTLSSSTTENSESKKDQ